jgi:multimeric flavodoxin WrbA
MEERKMLIVGISGSPRVGGNTDMILQEALTAAKEEGADVKLIRISDYSLQPCNACRTCFNTKECVIDDDGEKLYQEVVKAEGVILGSPSYFQGVTAQMKTFIDRIGYLALARERKDFIGKVGGVIAVARRSGAVRTCDQMIMFVTAVRMIIPSGGRAFTIGNKKGEVAKDTEGVKGARYLGKMMAKTIAATDSLRKSKST